MSLYLSYNIDSNNEKIISTSWSNTDIPILAISTENNKLMFYQDEGINISENNFIKENIITALSWHPIEKVLAFGQVDGKIGIWSDENKIKDEKSNHDKKITIIKFNNIGNRVVSVDESALIIVWRYEINLLRLCSYQQNFMVEEILFPRFIYEKMDFSKIPNQEKLETLFFFCNSSGVLHLADDCNSSPEICRVTGKIKSLLFYEKENAIILITSNLLLVKCTIHFNQQLTPKKVKLSIAGNADNIRCVWAGEGLIALISGDDIVRLFYLETDQAYFLSINDHELGKKVLDDSFSCIDYNIKKRMLIVGSIKGKVYMWKCNSTASIIPVSSDSWEPFCIVDTISNIIDIKWSKNMGLIHIFNNRYQHSMLSETILQRKMNNIMKVVQISHKSLEFIINTNDILEKATIKRIDLNDTIKGLDLFNNIILTWNGNMVYLFEANINSFILSKINCFPLKSNLLALNEDSIICGNGKNIDIYSYEGELKYKVPIDINYGEIIFFSSMNKFLLVVTSLNYFGIYDISRRTIKQIMMFRRFEKNGITIGEIRHASINFKGNSIAFLSDSVINFMRIPDTKIYIFDIEMDCFNSFEISKNKIPIEVHWDQNDPRLYGVLTEYARDINAEEEVIDFDEKMKKEWFGPEFYILFYSSEYGINKLESHKIDKDLQGVFAMDIPSIYFITNKVSDKSQNCLIDKKFLFFKGLDNIDDNLKLSLVEFSIFMSNGKLDEAYKIVKHIKNPLIWENLSKTCILTKNLEVLEVCLNNMKFTRGLKAFREGKYEKEKEVRLAEVAMHLNMIDEAMILLQESSRWDILIKFYISIGEYEKSINIAKNHNRINLENTYYRIAEHNEYLNDLDKAIEYYKLSSCAEREIPRMLIQKGRGDLLGKFMNESNNENSSWWAAYMESQGEIEKALEYYKKIKDWSNVVRLLLVVNRATEAKEIVDETKNQGAAFLIGRHYESVGDVKQAILYYTLSSRINQAFRLAKDNNMDPEIYNLGLKANFLTQNIIAEYFEKKGIYDKAITLYLLAGNIRKALNLCLLTNQYDKIREIADNIEYKNDKDTLRSLAEYFLEQKQYEKALNLFVKIKDYNTSINIIEKHKIKISIETANSILEDIENENNDKLKEEITNKLARLLMKQGDFEVAHQLFVKQGNLKKAMKCLIKLGYTERVIDFAHTCRIPELYVMAANFLQSNDWVDNEEIVKTIVSFFTKAKAFINLANFYDLFANVEINEFRNYEKAIILYREGINAIEKSKDDEEKKLKKISILNNKIKITSMFINITNIAKNNRDEALQLCNEMLNLTSIDDIVREGDIYGIMLEIYVLNKDYHPAYSVLETLRLQKKVITNYIDKETIDEILSKVGKVGNINIYLK